MAQRWSYTQEMEQVGKTQVFSGGACNILTRTGTLIRNEERDAINDWLHNKDVRFFDPQIHPDTHGVEYHYPTHHKIEVAAREAAKVNLYEVSPRTFGGITSFEIASDHFRHQEPTVIYFSDGHATGDDIPAHSEKGYPLFQPDGIYDNDHAMRAHYREFVKNGNNMRKYLMQFAREMSTLTVTFNEEVHKGDVIVSPERIHAADLYSAVVRAASGERVFVNFTGGTDCQDERGNPLFVVPDDPPEVMMHSLLDQYVDEGNDLRKAIANLIDVSVFIRVVYTQKSAILALEELLRMTDAL